jgi:hypothetical protein
MNGVSYNQVPVQPVQSTAEGYKILAFAQSVLDSNNKQAEAGLTPASLSWTLSQQKYVAVLVVHTFKTKEAFDLFRQQLQEKGRKASEEKNKLEQESKVK